MTELSMSGTEPRHPDDPRSALAQWVERHQRGAWRYLRFLGCEEGRVEDILQDALVAAVAADLPAKPEPVATAWLRTAVRNLYLMELRAARNRPQIRALSDQTEIDAAWQRFAGAGDGQESLEFLHECLELVAPRTRQVLGRFYGDGARRRVIATELGVGVEGVKTVLRRAKDELRQCIETKRRNA